MSTPAIHLARRSRVSFETPTPGALAEWLIRGHGFTEQMPMANEAYRLATDGMVVSIFTYGLVLAEGHQAEAAGLLLTDLCSGEAGVA